MLSDDERAVLDLESRRWTYAGHKETAIREQLAMSPTRYYQVLHSLLERDDALAYKPVLVNRLNRQLAARVRRR